MIILVLCWLTTVVVTGCTLKPKDVPSYTVDVYVRDANGAPVADAEVEAIADYRSVGVATSDGEGLASLQVPQEVKLQWILGLKGGLGFDYYENYDSPVYPPNTIAASSHQPR